MTVTKRFGIAGWRGLAGGVDSRQDWIDWASSKIVLGNHLAAPELESAPSRMSRRLGVLGKCVISVTEQCVPLLTDEPAVLVSSRHGDLPFMDGLIDRVRFQQDVSPTMFTYSVHNRLSSLVAMFLKFRGVNSAYSAVHDGFPIILAEAIYLIEERIVNQVLVIAYEPETPKKYRRIITESWPPHVVGFVVQPSANSLEIYSLSRCKRKHKGTDYRGSCLPFIRSMLSQQKQRDGYWGYSPV